jgi:hypothetical protein
MTAFDGSNAIWWVRLSASTTPTEVLRFVTKAEYCRKFWAIA